MDENCLVMFCCLESIVVSSNIISKQHTFVLSASTVFFEATAIPPS